MLSGYARTAIACCIATMANVIAYSGPMMVEATACGGPMMANATLQLATFQ